MKSSSPFSFLQKHSLDLISGLFFAVMIVGAFLAWPSADDFCYYNRAVAQGPLGMLKEEYFGWGGRYTSTLLMGIFSQLPAFISGSSFFVVPLLILSAICGGTYVLLRYGFEERSRHTVLLGSMVLIGALSWRESIFWMAGGITYGLSIGATLAVLGLVLGLEKLSKPMFGLLALLIFMSAGFNEGTPLLLGGFLGLMILKSWFTNRKQLLPLGALMAFALAGLAIEYAAPGNFMRSDAISREVKLLEGFNGFVYPLDYLLHGLCFFLLWSCIWALVPLKKVPEWMPRNPWMILGATYLLLLPSLFVRALLLSGPGPERALGIDILIVWLGMMVLALAVSGEAKKLSKPFLLAMFVGVLLAMPTAGPETFHAQLSQLTQYAPRVNKEFGKRVEMYKVSQGQDVVVEPLRKKWASSPTLLNDIDESHADWVNTCLAKAYGLNSVRLNAPSQ